jgi:hypothetical protein
MSIAAGRGWLAAGQGLTNIGSLLIAAQERQREQARQDLADKYAAQEQQMRLLKFQQDTGLNPDGSPTPDRGVYSGGAFVPTLGKQFTPAASTTPPVTIAPMTTATPMPPTPGPGDLPGMESAPVTQTPPVAVVPPRALPTVAPAATLPTIGQMASGQSPTPSGAVQVGRSAAQRTADARLKQAASEADVLASNNPGFAAQPWRQRVAMAGSPTLYDAFASRQGREATAAKAASDATDLATTAKVARQALGLPAGVADKYAVGQWMPQQRYENTPPRATPLSEGTLLERMRARVGQLQVELGHANLLTKHVTPASRADAVARMRRDGEFGEATPGQWQQVGTGAGAATAVPGSSAPLVLGAPSPAPRGAGGKLSVTQTEYDALARQYGAAVAAQHYIVGP